MAASALARARVAGGGVERSQVSELQRSRLLAGAVGAFDELGYAQTTVAHITARARVSRRTFYELFADREECLSGVLEEAVGLVMGELTAVGLEGVGWRERLRRGLSTILAFLDREPALGRVCVVEALRAGVAVQERREVLLAALAAAVDGGGRESARGEACTELTAEGLVGAGFAIVHRRLQRREHEPLMDLLGELMGMIVLPYLGPAAARGERAQPTPQAVVVSPAIRTHAPQSGGDPLQGVRMRLTYRTARVLEGVRELGGQGSYPSNRQVATHAGIADPGQISKLLRRLEDLGLLVNSGEGRHTRGERNAWALTAAGERLAQSIHLHSHYESEAA